MDRALPVTFLLLSLAGVAVVFAVPWMVVGSDIIEPRWMWVNEMFPIVGGSAPQAHLWALAGFVLGTAASAAWLTMTFLVPEAQWTPERRAAAASLVAPSLFLVASAGGMAIGYSILAADGNSWAYSPAGIALLAIAGLGTLLLLVALLRGLAVRRAPVAILGGTIVASALFQAIPWVTSTRASGAGAADTTNLTRAMFQFFGLDVLAPLGLALALLLLGALAWTLTVALVPGDARRSALIDASFAFAGFLPLALACVGVGRAVGIWLAGFEGGFFGGTVEGALGGTAETTDYAVNAYIFLALLFAAAATLTVVLARRVRALEAGWSS